MKRLREAVKLYEAEERYRFYTDVNVDLKSVKSSLLAKPDNHLDLDNAQAVEQHLADGFEKYAAKSLGGQFNGMEEHKPGVLTISFVFDSKDSNDIFNRKAKNLLVAWILKGKVENLGEIK